MINDFLTGVEVTDNMWIGGAHFYEKDEVEYSLVTKASVVPCEKVQGEKKEVIVKLNLRRLSDGLESKFKEAVAVDKLRNFIDYAKKDEKIDFLKGKVIGACYYENEPIQVVLNKYAILDK
jgi:hypothetical protein